MRRLATLALAPLVAFLFAQPGCTVRGTVTDTVGAVIAHAHVRILDADSRATLQSATTDSAGRFELSGLAAGNYLLSVSATGFSTAIEPSGMLVSGTLSMRDIRLQPLDCDGPGVNCDVFTEKPYVEPHPILSTHDLTLHAGSAIDLNKGTTLPLDAAGADIQLVARQNGLYLVPVSEATFATPLPEGSCRVRKPSLQELRIDGFDPDTEIVVRTQHGSCARLYITRTIEPGSHQIGLHLVTRRR